MKKHTKTVSFTRPSRNPWGLFLALAACLLGSISCGMDGEPDERLPTSAPTPAYQGHDLTRIPRSQADSMASELSSLARSVTREAATEPRRTGTWNNKKAGTYLCAVCGLPLYDSSTKFDSGTGWPSFYEAANEDHIETTVDHDTGYARTEVHCRRCESHLGHIFPDGYNTPTGMRHCINSVSMSFVPKGETWPERSQPSTSTPDNKSK